MNRDSVSVNYYGEVFSTSGYGTAIRSYIRALHTAGVRVAVASARRAPSVRDEFIESLMGRDPNADFNILHAIPLFWSRGAYRLPSVIAVTVWEADPIPEAWHRALSHAVDVWVPCSFNVKSFGASLSRAPFQLPYALPISGTRNVADLTISGLRSSDFVFYSIFDWQVRKNAQGMMAAFLQAFPNDCDSLLLLKTTPRADDEARHALDQARAITKSNARVVLKCEAWEEAEIEALHERGDCYLSLHRGEGWGYPIFEAAARGKPTIFSAQGGPLDFLDPQRHQLIPCRNVPVEEPYFLFTRQMKWGEPDLAVATKALRWVYENRETARINAEQAARELRATYSLGRVGAVAKARLLELLQEKTAAL